jgi:type IV pilus assembly protein PilW
MSTLPHTTRPRPHAAAGFTLVEMMIALVIALFLIAGMVLVFQNTRSTYTAQKSLAQLQDNERLAMTMIAEVIQATGYFPISSTGTANLPTALPASPNFPAQNDFNNIPNIAAATNAQGDTISVRYAAGAGDTIMNCLGQTNTGGAEVGWDDTLSVDANGYLTCQAWDSADGITTTAELVGGLATGAAGPSMTLMYGVDTVDTTSKTCPSGVDSYMTATQVTAGGYWGSVCAVKVSLVFTNPLPPADGLTPTITFTRVIDLMTKAGVNNS